MEQGDLHALVERARKEFVASFADDYNRLVQLAGGAGAGDSAALVELKLAAHRLVGRAGIIQLLTIARHASALETLARVDAVRHFDRGAATACLGELRDAFVEARAAILSDPPGGDVPAGGRSRLLVVVADADEEQRYLLTRVLQRAGFEVVPASTGRDAIALARTRKAAAILLDVRLADHDGATTIRMLKADPATAAIPVLCLQAQVDVERQAGQVAGANDHAARTIDPRQLIGRVRALCAGLSPSAG